MLWHLGVAPPAHAPMAPHPHRMQNAHLHTRVLIDTCLKTQTAPSALLFSLLQVACLQMPPECDTHFASFYGMFATALAPVLPPGTAVAAAYEAGTDDQQAFVHGLALFYTGFFKVGTPGGGMR